MRRQFTIEKQWDGNELVNERGNRIYVSRGRWQWVLLVDGEPYEAFDLKRAAVARAEQLQKERTR